jgi:hypothetical protein
MLSFKSLLYSCNNSSPPRIFAVLLYAYNNKIMTLTLMPFIHPNRCITCVQSFRSSALTHIPSLLLAVLLYAYNNNRSSGSDAYPNTRTTIK